MENETQNEEELKAKTEQTESSKDAGDEAVSETEDHGHDEIKETDSYKDKYYYVIAEMQNMQKRFEREKQGRS